MHFCFCTVLVPQITTLLTLTYYLAVGGLEGIIRWFMENGDNIVVVGTGDGKRYEAQK